MPAFKTDVSLEEAPLDWREVLPIKFCLYINDRFGKVQYEGVEIREAQRLTNRKWTHYYVFFQAWETSIPSRVLIFSQADDDPRLWGVA